MAMNPPMRRRKFFPARAATRSSIVGNCDRFRTRGRPMDDVRPGVSSRIAERSANSEGENRNVRCDGWRERPTFFRSRLRAAPGPRKDPSCSHVFPTVAAFRRRLLSLFHRSFQQPMERPPPRRRRHLRRRRNRESVRSWFARFSSLPSRSPQRSLLRVHGRMSVRTKGGRRSHRSSIRPTVRCRTARWALPSSPA